MSTFFTHWYLVYFFQGENILLWYSICRNFSLLHVYIFHALVPCLPFSRWECFEWYSIIYRTFLLLHVYFFHALVHCLLFSQWEYFIMLQHMEELLMASCLFFFFFSRSGTWSIFSTVRRFRADAAYVGTSHCFMSTFFTHWYLVYLLHGENVSFWYIKNSNFSLLHVTFFHENVEVAVKFTMSNR